MKILLVLLLHYVLGNKKNIKQVKSFYNKVMDGSMSFYHSLSMKDRGSCHDPFPSSAIKKNTWNTVALPLVGSNTYAGGLTCTMCIQVIVKHKNLKGEPHPSPEKKSRWPPANKKLVLYTSNSCHNCFFKNQLDVSWQNRKGLFQAKWKAVDCPIGKSPIELIFMPKSDKNYIGVLPRNVKIPVKKMEYFHPKQKKWVKMKRKKKTAYFVLVAKKMSDKFKMPLKFRITSLRNEKKIITALKWKPPYKPVPTREKTQFSKGLENKKIKLK